MRSLWQASLSLALTLVPVLGTGCVSLSSPRANVAAMARRTESKLDVARAEESRGNLTRAKQIYAEIHRQDPRNAECSHRLAVVCTRLNQHMEAEVYYLQAYANRPDDAALLSDMGYAAFLQKEYDKSESWLEKSVKLNGNDRRTINNLAIVRGWQVHDEASLATFRVLHDEAEAIRHLAAIQVARGDKDRGEKNFDLARRMTSPGTPATVAEVKPPEFEMPIELPAPALPHVEALPPLVAAVVETPPTGAAALLVSAESSTHANGAVSNSIAIVELPAPLPMQPPELNVVIELPPPALELSAPPVVPEPKAAIHEPVTPPLPKAVDIATKPQKQATRTAVPVPTVAAIKETLASPVIEAPTSDENFTFQRISSWQPTPTSRGGRTAEAAAPRLDSGTNQPWQPTAWNQAESTLGEICLVTLFEEKRIVPASTQYAIEHQSREYRFQSQEALEKFRATPDQFIPAAGGLDVVAVRNGRGVVQGSLNFSLWYRRQLYLFSSAEHAETFRRTPQTYAAAR